MNASIRLVSTELLKKGIFFFPLILVGVFAILKVIAPEFYGSINGEFGLVKNAQSLVCLIASVFALLVAVGFIKKGLRLYAALYALFAAGLFFVSMEEIGWALKIFNAPVPDYFKVHNIQSEVSLHNLPSVRWYVNEAYILLGFFCAFLWIIVPKRIKAIDPDTTGYLIPDRSLIGYFLPVFALYAYFVYLSGILVHLTGVNAFHIGFMNGPYIIDFIDQEPVEFLLTLGILIFVVRSKKRQAKQASFEVEKSARFVSSLFLYVLAIAIPFHFVHAFAERRLYPYDRLELGRLLYSQGKLDDAVEQYRLALRVDPVHAETYSNLGIVLMDLKKYQEADVCFLKAMKLSPSDASSEYNLGISLYRQGKVSDGAAHYTRALKTKPSLEKFIEFRPHDEVMLSQIGNSLAKQGKIQESLWFFSKALQVRLDYSTQYNLGSALLAAGKVDDAITHLAESLKLKSNNAPAHNNLANALVLKGNLDQALAHYSEALRMDPRLVDAHCNMGIVLKNQGKSKEAIEQFSEALRLDPKSEKARQNLKLLQKK